MGGGRANIGAVVLVDPPPLLAMLAPPEEVTTLSDPFSGNAISADINTFSKIPTTAAGASSTTPTPTGRDAILHRYTKPLESPRSYQEAVDPTCSQRVAMRLWKSLYHNTLSTG
jgi:hypothetical protein